MSAPPPDSPPSISSSGHSDGLGRRAVVFDREDGAMLEALHVRPELSAFEGALRERIERLGAFEDERFARIRGVDRDPDTGELVVISEFVPGTRLCDLLDVAQERAQEGITPGVDVALGYLLEALPAISALHAAAGVTHGAIAPARTVLTPAGQVVFLDTPYGEILERLHFSRKRLWVEFGLAMPASAGIARFDVSADIGQVALNAVMLVLGRPLRENEYPAALAPLMMEVVEVAQIRGTPNFAGGIQRFLQRALPLAGRRAYDNADEATIDIRQVARQEIGLPICHRALIEFVTETAGGLASLQVPPAQSEPAAASAREATDQVDADGLTASLDVIEEEEEPAVDAEAAEEPIETSEEVPLEQEIALDAAAVEEPEPTYEISAAADGQVEVEDFATVLADRLNAIASAIEPPPEPVVAEPFVAEPVVAEPFVPEPVVTEPVAPEPVAPEPVAPEPVAPEPFVPEPVVAEPFAPESPRRKRQRSARARKDKLRSITTAAQGGGAAPRMAPPPLVSPDRAAAYDNDDFSPSPRTIGFGPPPAPTAPPQPAPPQPAFAPAALAPPAAPIPMPQFPAAPGPSPYAGPATTIWSAPPVPPEPLAAPPKPIDLPPPKPLTVVQPLPPPAPLAPAPIRLKSDTGATWAAKAPRAEARVDKPVSESHVPLPEVERRVPEQPRAFPWKLAAALIIIVAAGIAGGRYYLPGRQAEAPPDAAAAATTPAAPAKRPQAPPPANAGHVEIQTQPAGAHVLLDGQPAGETPLTLDVTPGRHVLTFVSASGSIKRNVRVDAGKSISLDVPLFSGWVSVFAPIVLDIAENGKSIGSTEDGRLMLAPGRHELTLTNRELGYVGKQSVEIEPGEVNTVNVDPRGSVNFNAVPWAEVWIDGKKAGDTPLANAQVPLGIREIVFKNPDYGERKIVTTVRADTVGAVTVDFTSK